MEYQNKAMYKVRDMLRKGLDSGDLKLNRDLKLLFTFNNQELPEPFGEEIVRAVYTYTSCMTHYMSLERFAKIMVFPIAGSGSAL
jgi:hypothetical protein